MKHIILLLLILSLFSCSPSGEQKTSKEVNDKIFLKLGGEEQYVEILGKSASNPVMLFIHGGPGWPQTPQIRYYNSELAEKFTLAIWEQRGAGKSFMKNPTPENLNLDQIIQDGQELTQWLKEKYGKEKIYLAGYSWGSIIGVKMAEQTPEDYLAYLGIAQFVNNDMGMAISQRWLETQIAESGDEADQATLDSLKNPSNYPTQTARFFRQWQLLNKYHGAVYNAEADKETTKAMSMYEDYKDYNWEKAWEISSKKLSDALYETNIMEITSLETPVYLFEGRHDWNVPSVLALEWLQTLDAPQKNIFWFEESGHGPLEEEPQKFNQAVLSLIK